MNASPVTRELRVCHVAPLLVERWTWYPRFETPAVMVVGAVQLNVVSWAPMPTEAFARTAEPTMEVRAFGGVVDTGAPAGVAPSYPAT